MNHDLNEKLAIEGGTPAFGGPPPVWPRQDPAVRAALEQAWADGSWGRYHGPNGERLTQALAQRHEVEFAMLCCSGTFAVELALRGLKIQPDDEVILAGYDFPGNFRAIEAVGAVPVLADIRTDNWALDLVGLDSAVGARTRAIVVSHLHGSVADMPGICELAGRRGLSVVEDACQAAGGRLAGRPLGSWGDVGVHSFGGSKLLTAGRGGALVTRHAEVFQRAKIYNERGNQAFPLSELQAAVLWPQLATLDEYHRRRKTAVRELLRLTTGLAGLRPVALPQPPAEPAFYKLGLYFQPEELAECDIRRFVAAAQAEGVPLDRGFPGFVLRSQRRCRAAGELPNSRRAAQATLVLHHPVLLESSETLHAVAHGLKKISARFDARGGHQAGH